MLERSTRGTLSVLLAGLLAAGFGIVCLSTSIPVDQHLCALTVRDPYGSDWVAVFVANDGDLNIGLWHGLGSALTVQLAHGRPAGVTRVSDPTAVTYYSPTYRATVLEAYVVGSDSHLWRYRTYLWAKDTGVPAGQWDDCMTPGQALVGTPSAVVTGLITLTSRALVFVQGDDGLFYTYLDGSWTELGSPGVPPYSKPHAIAFIEGSFPFWNDYSYMFVTGGNGHLYMSAGIPSDWTDLGPPSGGLGATRPSAVASMPAGAARTQIDVFVVTAGGALRRWHADGASRTWSTESKPGNGGYGTTNWDISSAPGGGVFYPRTTADLPWGPIGSAQVRAWTWGCVTGSTGPCPTSRLVGWLDGSIWKWNWQQAPSWGHEYRTLVLTAPEVIVYQGAMTAFVGAVAALTVAPMTIYANYWDGSNWQWVTVGYFPL